MRQFTYKINIGEMDECSRQQQINKLNEFTEAVGFDSVF